VRATPRTAQSSRPRTLPQAYGYAWTPPPSGGVPDPPEITLRIARTRQRHKRQLLNALHAITLYNRIKDHPHGNTCAHHIFAAGGVGYFLAKLIIKLIHRHWGPGSIHDADVGRCWRVVFLAYYRVSWRSASSRLPSCRSRSLRRDRGLGTGNMKFAPQRASQPSYDGWRQHRDSRGGRRRQHRFLRPDTTQVNALKPHYNLYYAWSNTMTRHTPDMDIPRNAWSC